MKQSAAGKRDRPLIAFFDFHDVFEDFYPHYGVDQESFTSTWANTGSHAWLSLIQKELADVIWYTFSLSPEPGERRHRVTGFRVRMLRSSWLHRRLWSLFYLSRNSWRWCHRYQTYAGIASYAAPLSTSLLRQLRGDRPDMIFVQDYATGRFDVFLLIARAMGIPVVAVHTGSRPQAYTGKFLRRYTLSRADWLFPSGKAEREMLRRTYGVSSDRMAIVYPTVDTGVYRPADRDLACQRLGLDPRRRYVLSIGRLEDGAKRISTLIESFARLRYEYPDTDLLIAGDGPDRSCLESMARSLVRRNEAEHGGEILFLGWIAEDTHKAAFYNIGECLALPSAKEGLPFSVAEALACGTPVVATNVGTVPDLVVAGKTGVLIELDDERALDAALSSVLSGELPLSIMRHEARRTAETLLAPEAATAVFRKSLESIGLTPAR
jgi:glycosyltransferase involved in cell wall biosynthesis